MFLVFDIETVPDVEALARWLHLPPRSDPDAVMAAWREARPEAVMPKPPFQQVVAIAGAVIGEDGRLETLKAMGEADEGEEQLLRRFFAYVERARPRLVGWNSSGFDLPCLLYRAMAHQLSLEAFYRQRNYRYRYNEDIHLDLMDLLAGYGATVRVALDEMAAVLRLPGKLGVDGQDVWPLYRQGRIDVIRAYCETDVLTTTLIFARYAAHRRLLDQARSAALTESIEQFLAQAGGPHFREFREAWEALDPDRGLPPS